MNSITEIIAEMTLEEKASLCSGLDFWHTKGIERLGIPSMLVTDGPHGLRKQVENSSEIGITDSVPATCFPTGSALASTWDRDLIHAVGEALGEECRQEKVGVILGPGANIKRSPLCGRNFEYFSEDPYLSGEIAKSQINGVQSQGIGTSLKHYAANNQEYRRMSIDVIVDQRALREIYLAGFEIAVKGAQPWTVMGAYNQVNGRFCCEHDQILRKILIEEWAHEGFVMTDWGAMNERVPALSAGLALEMPGPNPGNDELIVEAIQNGRLDETLLDDAVARMLNVIFKAELTLADDFNYDRAAHHSLARRTAAEGAVLLKNAAKTLPIKKSTKVAILGEFAKTPRYQGAGSSLINPTQMDNLVEEVIKIAGKDSVSFAAGYSISGSDPDEELIQEAVELARTAETAVVCVGLPDKFEVEGLDREHMALPKNHNRLVEAVAEVNSNVVVVLSNGSPVEMPWVDQVSAILEGHLGGQAGAGGLADVLYGLVCPSGKLAETFPIKVADTPSYSSFPGGPNTVEYRESIFVGYRFYNTVDKAVLFPFGHGLSYTTFEYSDLVLSQENISDRDTLTVQLKVKNTGQVEGKEIVQLYVGMENSAVFRARAELKGFEKISLKPGEEKAVTFKLSHRAFAYYNTAINDWYMENGTYQISVGASSTDIRLNAKITVETMQTEVPVYPGDQLDAYLNFSADAQISQQDFEKLIDRSLPSNQPTRAGAYTLSTPISDMQGSFIGRILAGVMKKQAAKVVESDPDSPTALMIQTIIISMPLRGLRIASPNISRGMLEAILQMINGQVFKGIGAMWKAIARQRKAR